MNTMVCVGPTWSIRSGSGASHGDNAMFMPYAKHVAGLIRGTRHQSESRALLKFIASPDAAAYFRRCGLQPA